MTKKLTTKDVICRFKEKHGDKYSYDNVTYVNAVTKVAITCPEHGDFWQTPNSHLSGKGCPKCGSARCSKSRRISRDEWLKRWSETHGDRYDYSLADPKGSHKKVTIICRDHGEFQQVAKSHQSGQGCPKCANSKISESRKISAEEWLDRCLEEHGDKYDYSRAVYRSSKEKVCILCKKHGEFWQDAWSHQNGAGCTKCKYENDIGRLALSQEEFISRSIETHGEGRYDYSESEYSNSITKVKIKCLKCTNVFWQTPANHMYQGGRGCPACKESRGEKAIRSLLEESGVEFDSQWKPEDGVYGNKRMSFDFKINDTLVEFDGKQHFEPVEALGGVKEFKKVVERDLMKTKWAIENDFRLVRIGYHEADQIPETLGEELAIYV